MTADYSQARAARRHRLHQRQTVILGSIALALGVLLLISSLTWFGALPSPFARDFNSPPPVESGTALTCPPEGAVTVGLNEITAAVYNATNIGGLAGSVSSQLTGAGVTITQTDNWGERFEGVGMLRTGTLGLEEAYTLQLVFPGMIVTLDSREDDAVDVVLGSGYGSMADLTTIVPGLSIPVPTECLPEAAPETTAGTESEDTVPAEE